MKRVLFIMPYGKKKIPGDKSTTLIDFDAEYMKYKKLIEQCGNYDVYNTNKSMAGDINWMKCQRIVYADIVFVDLTNFAFNPNVMYELGIRHAKKDKVTVLFRTWDDGSDNPFNIRHWNDHKELFKDDKYEKAEDKVKKCLQLKWIDSPVIKSLDPLDKDIFKKNAPISWKAFIDDYNGYNRKNGYGGLWKIIEKYNEHLEGMEEFDQKKALILYKSKEVDFIKPFENSLKALDRIAKVKSMSTLEPSLKALSEIKKNDFINTLEHSLKILEKYNPLTSSNYETIGLFASILRKIYENKKIPDNMPKEKRIAEYFYAKRVAEYFYLKYNDAYSISSYFLIHVAICEHGDISFADLKRVTQKLKDGFRHLVKSNDDHLGDIKKLIVYFLDKKNKSQEEMNFDFEESAVPVFKRIQKLKRKYAQSKH